MFQIKMQFFGGGGEIIYSHKMFCLETTALVILQSLLISDLIINHVQASCCLIGTTALYIPVFILFLSSVLSNDK